MPDPQYFYNDRQAVRATKGAHDDRIAALVERLGYIVSGKSQHTRWGGGLHAQRGPEVKTPAMLF